jgi:hypothetical protein
MTEEAPSTLIERNRLNDLIEESYGESALSAVAILRYKHDQRGALVDMFPRFFEPFSLLVLLTSGMPQMQTKPELLEKARLWARQQAKTDKLADIYAKLLEGVDIFDEYARTLQEAGVIRLTSRGS